MLNERRLNKQGSVTIPSHLRRELGLREGEKLKIAVDGESIKLERIQGSCVVCGSTERTKILRNVFLCNDCIQEIKRMV